MNYNNIMVMHIIVAFLVLSIAYAAVIIITINVIELVKLGQNTHILSASIVALLALGLSIFMIPGMVDNFKDIKQQSYITYEGEVKFGANHGFGPVATLQDKSKTVVSLNRWYPDTEDRIYYGTLVYAEHSKILLNWEVQK